MKAFTKPLIFGSLHGLLLAVGMGSFLLYFYISEYNDPVTGALVLHEQYGWLAEICEYIPLVSLALGAVLLVINIITLIKDKQAVGKAKLWYLITPPVAVIIAVLLCMAIMPVLTGMLS